MTDTAKQNQEPDGQVVALSPLARTGFLVTNLIKLGGLAIAINEVLLRSELRPVALGVAAFMMAGAQGIETLFDRLLGPT